MKGIRVLVSSKYLYSRLARFDFERNPVERVTLEDNILTVIGGDQAVEITVHTIDFIASLRQSGRWDFVKQTVGHVNEQPVVLHIFQNTVNLIFQY